MKVIPGQEIIIKIPHDISEQDLLLIRSLLKEGGSDLLGRVLISKLEEATINAPEAAKRHGFSRRYAAKIARKAFEEGEKWPKKVGNTWMAPPHIWDTLFKKQKKSKKYKF